VQSVVHKKAGSIEDGQLRSGKMEDGQLANSSSVGRPVSAIFALNHLLCVSAAPRETLRFAICV